MGSKHAITGTNADVNENTIAKTDYGVFLGIDRDEMDCLEEFDTVVIEPEEFTEEDIKKLHQSGKAVYAYLNVGSIEQYRFYYKKYEPFTLDVYDNWPDEKWMDVTREEWQEFLITDRSREITDKAFDGFFIDNCDVYAEYETDAVFEGLCTILTGIKQQDLSVIINGGDVFVSRAINNGLANGIMDGVNQETVFTSINFETETYAAQKEEETAYFTNYLEKVKNEGFEVYLLEYGADSVLEKQIDAYCSKNGFYWYNAPSLDLGVE